MSIDYEEYSVFIFISSTGVDSKPHNRRMLYFKTFDVIISPADGHAFVENLDKNYLICFCNYSNPLISIVFPLNDCLGPYVDFMRDLKLLIGEIQKTD